MQQPDSLAREAEDNTGVALFYHCSLFKCCSIPARSREVRLVCVDDEVGSVPPLLGAHQLHLRSCLRSTFLTTWSLFMRGLGLVLRYHWVGVVMTVPTASGQKSRFVVVVSSLLRIKLRSLILTLPGTFSPQTERLPSRQGAWSPNDSQATPPVAP